MKNLTLAIGSSLGLMMAGCPGDDGTTSDGDTVNVTSTGTTDAMDTSTTGDPSDTTGDPPGTTTGDPPDDTTTDDTSGSTTASGCMPVDTEGGGPSFEAEVFPIIEASGCIGLPGTCHDASSGGLSMSDAPTTLGNLVDVASTQSGLVRIAPGCPEDSYLWAKVTDTHMDVGGLGNRMPLGLPPLEQAELDTIEQWILGGAQP